VFLYGLFKSLWLVKLPVSIEQDLLSEPIDDIIKDLVPGQFLNKDMIFVVVLEVRFVLLFAVVFFNLRMEGLYFSEVFFLHLFCGEPGASSFQDTHNFEHILNFFNRGLADICALIGDEINEAFRTENAERFPYGRSAYAHGFTEVFFIYFLPLDQDSISDHASDLIGDFLMEGLCLDFVHAGFLATWNKIL